MKIKLLLFFGFCAFANAQSIHEFYGHLPIPSEWPYDGYSHRSYFVLSSDAPLDQSASGTDAVWTFDQLTTLGGSEYIDSEPTPADLSNFPGTTRILTGTNSVGIVPTVSTAYLSGDAAFVGLSAGNGLELHYTDNATIGSFPLSYGYTNTDAIAGTFTYTTYSGTFTGSIVSSVDAYGTLNYGNGADLTAMNVTRLKIVQNLNLDYFPLGTVGTVTMTNYYYYYNGPDPMQQDFPNFVSSETAANIPLLSIDQDITTIEVGIPAFLGTPQFGRESVSIAPNPVSDVLSIHVNDNIAIQSVTITDVNGRVISKSNETNFDVSKLAKGVYFARIESDSGTAIKKFAKQ